MERPFKLALIIIVFSTVSLILVKGIQNFVQEARSNEAIEQTLNHAALYDLNTSDNLFGHGPDAFVLVQHTHVDSPCVHPRSGV